MEKKDTTQNKKGIQLNKKLAGRIGGITLLAVFALGIAFVGYRVVITAGDVPGRLCSISTAAKNLNCVRSEISRAQKISYEEMRYGYMDDLLLAQMDDLDKRYESERMEEIRAVNDLTAMSDKTSDKIAYEKAQEEREKERQLALAAAKAVEAVRQSKMNALAAAVSGRGRVNADGTVFINTGGSGDTGSGDTASNGGQVGTPVYATTHGQSLGVFSITAYCTCRICCGVYSGRNRTASGTVPTSNRTIAVDTSVIPFGTRVVINGQVYVAEDRGGAIKGNRIDMFFMTHAEALRWGRRSMEVFLAD